MKEKIDWNAINEIKNKKINERIIPKGRRNWDKITKDKKANWNQLRRKRLEIDKFRCYLCGSKKNLCVHHLCYENFGNENLEDVLTLCRKCHMIAHKKGYASWEYEKDAIIITKQGRNYNCKGYMVMLIDKELWSRIGSPEKVNISFCESGEIVEIKKSIRGEFNLEKTIFKGREMLRLRLSLFNLFSCQSLKYVEIRQSIKNKSIKFYLKKKD